MSEPGSEQSVTGAAVPADEIEAPVRANAPGELAAAGEVTAVAVEPTVPSGEFGVPPVVDKATGSPANEPGEPAVSDEPTTRAIAADEAAVANESTIPANAPGEPATAPGEPATEAAVEKPGEAAAVAGADKPGETAAEADADKPGGIEAKAAEQLHGLIERGADMLPGEQGGMVSRFAVALLSFGSAMTQRGEKQTSALATEAVQLFKSLDGEPEKQRAAMETAISNLGSNLLGGQERGKVVDVAQQAMGLWKSSGGGIAGAAGAAASLAKSDSALSLRSLAGFLRGNGDDDGATKSEEEARKLEEN